MITNLIIAFFAGFISFLSPCVLPLIPGYVSYISGQTLNQIVENKVSVVLKTVFFSIGFSVVFISFGVTASFIGKILVNYSNYLRLFAGIIIIIFSLQIIGITNFKLLNTEKKYYTKDYSNNLIFPTLVGIAFGFGWTPCIGPILGSILVMATVEETIPKSILLLCFYSLGLAIPFIISGYAIQKFFLISKTIKKYTSKIMQIAGFILLITGILILTNQLQIFGFYILNLLPFLSKLG